MADLRDRAACDFTIDNTEPGDKISDNFYVRELVKSDIATRHKINNWFETDVQLQAAVVLCRNVLQPLRDRFWPFSPSSVYRSQHLERALKKRPKSWISKSQHTKGEAADVEIAGLTTLQLAEWIRDHLVFDQLILEHYNPQEGPNSGWVHVSLSSGSNRGEVLSYVERNGKFVYVNGIWKSDT